MSICSYFSTSSLYLAAKSSTALSEIIGKKFSITKKFTESDVKAFGNMIGDHNSIHFSHGDKKSILKSSSSSQKPIVQGTLLMGLFSGIAASQFPGEGSLYGKQTITFQEPVFVGDEVTATMTLQKIWKNQYFYFKTEIFKQIQDAKKHQVVCTGEAVVFNKNASLDKIQKL